MHLYRLHFYCHSSTLAELNKLVAQETPETGYQFIVTDSNTIAADTNGKYFNEPIKNLTAHAESSGLYTTNKAIDCEVFQVHVDTTFRQLDTHCDVVTILPKKTILGPVYQSIAYLVIGAILMVIALIFVIRTIVNKQLRPLKNVKQQLGLAASGDLQAVVDEAHVSEDEIGQVAATYNQMLSQTSSVVRQVQQASSTLQGNAANTFGVIQKIALGNDESVEAIQEIAKDAHHQSEEMETTLRNMQMLSEAIAQVEAISNQMDERAKQSIVEVQLGLEQIAALKRSQQMTDQSNEQLSAEMHNLVRTMGEITKIIDTIDDISEQTNLLSLTASIENEDLQRMKQQMNEVNTLSDALLDSVSTFKLT